MAHILAPFLAAIGAPMAPHIWHVLRSDDQAWKYWILGWIMPSLPEDVAAQFRPELARLCHAPTESERQEELDHQARDVLVHFG